ncbi:hypothetical protein TcWFU_003785 [Taenia crassiceps]|uniref:Uncharacterized protein n=1 Tax=Taenia crassiceps TaxID=6207 RepID=A0ABR4QKH2_9CEST
MVHLRSLGDYLFVPDLKCHLKSMVIPDPLRGSFPTLSSTKSVDLPRDSSSTKIKGHCGHREGDHGSLHLRINRRSSLATVVITSSDTPTLEVDFPSSSRPASQHQTIGLRTKKYIIPRLLSHRKLALSVLHPSSAAVMNDIHYLLKAHITPKAHFQKVDHIILRSLIKVGIVSEELMDYRPAVVQMRRVERLSRNFGLIFSDLLSAAEETSALPSSSTPSCRLDVSALLDTLKKLQEALNILTKGQLSANSISQMNAVFEELQDVHLWQHVFNHSIATSEEWQLVRNLRNSFNELIEAKLL